ncbi:MAG: DUF2845 domain-containing protein [Comamonadaceae bacterium]|nr:MAG: DUF2845 domain-containing protein [Comamonadaceae bacterium]
MQIANRANSRKIASIASAAASLVFVALLAVSGGASAQSLRCKGDLAQVGDSKGSVLQKCGEPVLKDSFCKPAVGVYVPKSAAPGTTININTCDQVDEWTYNPGYGQFMTMLQFEGGELKRIRYGDRVTR